MKDSDSEVKSKKSKDDNRAKHKAILSDYSGFSWLKTVEFRLWRTTVVWLVIKSSHIRDLTLR